MYGGSYHAENLKAEKTLYENSADEKCNISYILAMLKALE